MLLKTKIYFNNNRAIKNDRIMSIISYHPTSTKIKKGKIFIL